MGHVHTNAYARSLRAVPSDSPRWMISPLDTGMMTLFTMMEPSAFTVYSISVRYSKPSLPFCGSSGCAGLFCPPLGGFPICRFPFAVGKGLCVANRRSLVYRCRWEHGRGSVRVLCSSGGRCSVYTPTKFLLLWEDGFETLAFHHQCVGSFV